MMVENWEENLKQKYNDFHKNHIFLPYIKGREEEGRKEEEKRWEEREKGQDRQEKYFFPRLQKGGKLCEVSANSVINWVNLY